MAARDPELAEKVDFTQLKTIREYAKVIERENLLRAEKLKKLRVRNLTVGALLGASVLGIYSYSIFSVKQETFLDDFEEPAREQI